VAALANLATGVFIARYTIVTIIGFSLGTSLLCRLAAARRPEIALLLAAWVALSAAGSAVTARYVMRAKMVTTQHIAAGRGCFRLLILWDKLPADGLPIVVATSTSSINSITMPLSR
jgi:pimeloyl-ACP methyl ester carboxylesterase